MFQKVTTDETIDTVVTLAHEIWTQHYTPIIGSEQVKYMLAHFHSKDVISNQIKQEKYSYFLIENNGKPIGYLGVQIKDDKLFLSKLYVLASERGAGAGKSAISFTKNFARENKLDTISLTVNIHNTDTINAYYKLGFVKVGEVCADIGQGYVMDDYVMELSL